MDARVGQVRALLARGGDAAASRTAGSDPQPRPERVAIRRLSDHALRVIGWALCGLCLLPGLTHTIVLATQRPMVPQPWWYTAAGTIGLLGAPVVGGLIVARHPRRPYGWTWLGLGGAAGVVEGTAAASWLPSGGAPSGGVIGVLAGWVGELLVGWAFVGVLVSVALILLLFPDSRPPSARWHWATRAILWVGGVVAVVLPFAPAPAGAQPAPIVADGALGTLCLAVLDGGIAVLFGLILVSTAAVPVRWRRADPVQRHQLKWFALGAAWFAPALVLTAFFDRLLPSWVAAVVLFTQFVALQVAVGIAVLRHGLYDVDRVINRTLLYGTVSACLLAVYFGVVAGSSVVLADHVDGAAQGLATAAVAVTVLPVRTRVQKAVDRLTFGRRGDPYEVLAELGHRLEAAAAAETVLPGIVESVAVTLSLPYVAVTLRRGEDVVPGASYGRPAAEPVAFALSHQGEQVGVLLASPRSPREGLTATDRRLLADLARHAGVAVHAVLLADDLRRSRARVLAAREEERRRLRRDLHDGLGPTLAAVALGLDSARRRLHEPERVGPALAMLSADLQGTIEEIRRLVHDLRPPALDQFGLVDAIRADARRFETEAATRPDGLAIHIDAPVTNPRLPAAVEVAAYRIAGEALTNVVRHSGARRCVVRVRFDEFLHLEIADDGRGIPVEHRRGVGLSSMVERADEVGGRCEVVSTEHAGTQVRARLPLEAPP